MKSIYLQLYGFFLFVFPKYGHLVKSFIYKALALYITFFKALKKSIRIAYMYMKRLLLPFKILYSKYKIKTDPSWEQDQVNILWSKVWKEEGVYKKNLFQGWGKDIGEYLSRTNEQIPTQRVALPKLCVVGRPGSTHFVEPILKSISMSFEIYYQPFIDCGFSENAGGYDYIWFEWGTSGWPMSQLRKLKDSGALENTKIIIRVHDFELKRRDVMEFTDWSVADQIVFINRSAQKDFIEKHPLIDKKKMIFIPNVINEKSFSLKERQSENEFRILINCIKLSERKGLDEALSLFSTVFEQDARFSLTIRTTSISSKRDMKLLAKKIKKLSLPSGIVTLRVDNEEELSGLSESAIAFDIATNYSISRMYHEFDILWSTSLREGFHYAIAEGMLSGLYPVVRDWEWGQPRDFWGPYVASNDEDFVRRTLQFARLNNSEKKLKSSEHRNYVVNEFGLRVSAERLTKLLFTGHEASSLVPTKKPKRVIFFAHNHLYAENPRGGEHSSAEVLRGLRSQGYECLVVVQNRKSKRLERCIYDGGMPVISLPGEVFRLGIKEIMLWWQPDVAMVWEIPTLDMWEVCKSRGIPYIVFVRFWHIVAPPPYLNLLQQKQDESFLRQRRPVFQNAHTVISNARDTADVIAHLYQKESLVSYVPVQKLEPIEGAQAKYITLINPGKTMGAEGLIYRIAEAMPDLQFKVFQGDESDNLSANVEHSPYCDKGYNYMFSDTKLLIFPFGGHPCGTGRVVFECYHLGIPVVGSRVAGLPEIIPRDHIVNSTENVDEWVVLIRSMLSKYSESQQKISGIADAFTAESQLSVVYDAVSDACEESINRTL